MNDLPDHPARAQAQFLMLRQVEPARWGVKMNMKGTQAGGTWWQSQGIKWVYGPTAKEALDAALAACMFHALNGDSP